MGLSDEETGVYMKMLAFQWLKGGLPNDAKSVRIAINSRKNPSENVMKKFTVSDDGLLRNERLEKEREKQAKFRESRAENAVKRWSKKSTSNARASSSICTAPCTEDALQSSSSTSVKDKEALPFSSKEFTEAWTDWKQFRKEKKSPVTPTMGKAQLAKMAELGEARSIAMIRHTIEKGWQGLREPDAQPELGSTTKWITT